MDHLQRYLALGSPERIAAEVAREQTSMGSPVGQAAQTASIVLATRQVSETAERLDDAATKLQRASLGLAIASLAVSVAALIVAVIALL